ncbi:MAG: hypothetical protein HYU02_00840 [Thaumarchaeota archaeon]|nr:hypothetical protein [Nitrososphaerota archaeon]
MLTELVQEQENKFLSRKEVTVSFKDIKGTLKRDDAANAVAQQLSVDKSKVFPIKINFQAGASSAKGVFYIYDNPELAKKYLPKHLMLRSLSKEERQKAVEAAKQSKAAPVAAPPKAEAKAEAPKAAASKEEKK